MPELIQNGYYIYFISCVAVLTYEGFSKQQKLFVIYIITYALAVLSNLNIQYIIITMMAFLFALEEYLLGDKMKIQLVRRPISKLLDYLFQFVFADAGVWIVLSIFVYSFQSYESIEKLSKVYNVDFENLIMAFSVLGFVIGIHRLMTPSFVIESFDRIYKKIEAVPIWKVDYDSIETIKVFSLLSSIEDKFYFERTKSYSWFSLEFIRLKRNAVQYKLFVPGPRKSIEYLLWAIKKYRRENGCLKTIIYINKRIILDFRQNHYVIAELRRRFFNCFRGYSTLEMQLIRNIGIVEGYTRKYRRKIYELIYTKIICGGLKNYYDRYYWRGRNSYKMILIYIYFYYIGTEINGTSYSKLVDIFLNEDQQEKKETIAFDKYPLELFFVLFLGLNHRKINENRLEAYRYIIADYRLDIQKILRLAEILKQKSVLEVDSDDNSDEKLRVRNINIKSIINDIEEKKYINAIQIPLIIDGVYYGPDKWPSYGENRCWEFAFEVYWKIWGETFSSELDTPDNIIPVGCTLDERMITEYNVHSWFKKAQNGSVIRLTDNINGDDSVGNNMHSQILVGYENGNITIYESTNERTSLSEYSVKEYVNRYGKYKYFKYIKAPIEE